MKFEISITVIAIATMSLLIHGGAFGKTCETYEDGSFSCIGDKVLNVDKDKGNNDKYCKVVTFEGNDKCDTSKKGKGLNTDTFEVSDNDNTRKTEHKDNCTIYEDGSNDCNKKIDLKQWDCSTMGNKQCGNNDNDNDNDNHKSTNSQNKQDYNEEILQHLDNICRDQYYKFCLGGSWNSLVEALTN